MEKNNIETRVQTYLTANEAMEKALKLPPTKALYKTFWYENELCIFFAESNVGKSLYAKMCIRDSAMIAASWVAHNARKDEKSNKNEFGGLSPDTVSYAMGYGRGSNFYCGD